MQHLMASGSHSLDHNAAKKVVNQVTVSYWSETYQEREQYRQSLTKMYASHHSGEDDSQGKGKSNDKGKGEDKGKGKDSKKELQKQLKRTSDDVAQLSQSVQQLVKVQRGSAASSASAASSGSVTIAISDLELVHDSLNRASHACEQCENVCTKLAKQFSDEHKVLSKAKEILHGLVVKHGEVVRLT